MTLLARLGPARLRVQVDVGIGDVVTPEPAWLEYPSMLDLPRPRLLAYRPETAIAEKVHAMVVLGTKNSRMRDFFDVHALAARESFDGDTLAGSLRATFQCRGTEIPAALPVALTPAFAEAEGKQAQWVGFLRKSRLTTAAEELDSVTRALAAFLAPVLAAAAAGGSWRSHWRPGGPWIPSEVACKPPK